VPVSDLQIQVDAAPPTTNQQPRANGQQLPSNQFLPDPNLPGRRRSILRQRAQFEQQAGKSA
jgi:hypothetical protein